jgi:hypothetical protein
MSKVIRFVPLSLLAFALIHITSGPLLACSCGRGSSSLCDQVGAGGAAFTGTVLSINLAQTAVHPTMLAAPAVGALRQYTQRVVRFRIKDAATGIATGQKEVEVVTGIGGGDCGYDFAPGADYMVFAHRNGANALATGTCSPTRRLTASEDSAFHALATGATNPPSPVSLQVMDFTGNTVRDARVTAEAAGKSYSATTDASGMKLFSALAPGEYTLSVEMKGFRPNKSTLTIPERGCLRKPFTRILLENSP